MPHPAVWPTIRVNGFNGEQANASTAIEIDPKILALMRLPSPALVEEFDSADEWHRDELHTQHILGRILVLRDDADARRFVETRRGALRELLKPRPRDADGLNLRSAAAPPEPAAAAAEEEAAAE